MQHTCIPVILIFCQANIFADKNFFIKNFNCIYECTYDPFVIALKTNNYIIYTDKLHWPSLVKWGKIDEKLTQEN